ncbi:MAG TPA: cupin domain-containing protein [Actinomycetota bacterium]|nr:cupin domain-containing protein [Actinomycetota bacterium]
MAKVGKASAAEQMAAEGYEGAFGEVGDYTVAFESYSEDTDPAPLFKGLPNDHCQCPHWGVVLKGKLIYRYEDGTQDEIEAGEAYYARPGHLPLFMAGTEDIEFSPTSELQQTIEVVTRNLEAMGASSSS